MLLLKIIHKDVQKDSIDRCVASSLTQAGAERKSIMNFKRNC